MIGITDPAVRQKLQLKTDLTLTQAIETIRNAELVRSQNFHSQSHLTTKMNNLDAVSQRGKTQQWKKGSSEPRRGRGGRQYVARQGQGQDCGNCRYKHEKDKEHCPAQHSKCRSCQRIGHYAIKCRRKGSATISTANVEQVTAHPRDCQDSGLPLHLGSVLDAYITRYDAEEPWCTTLQLRGGEVTFKIDSGADVSIMTEADWKRLRPRPNLKATDVKLTIPGGPLTSKGHFIARVEHSRQVYNFRVIVSGAESTCLVRLVWSSVTQ